jgi:hypothetical protein
MLPGSTGRAIRGRPSGCGEADVEGVPGASPESVGPGELTEAGVAPPHAARIRMRNAIVAHALRREMLVRVIAPPRRVAGPAVLLRPTSMIITR